MGVFVWVCDVKKTTKTNATSEQTNTQLAKTPGNITQGEGVAPPPPKTCAQQSNRIEMPKILISTNVAYPNWLFVCPILTNPTVLKSYNLYKT